jgi:hypothetical protein
VNCQSLFGDDYLSGSLLGGFSRIRENRRSHHYHEWKNAVHGEGWLK